MQSRSAATGTYQQRLRGFGLRSTGARVAVLRVMDKAKQPLSHGEVAGRVRGGVRFDLATIYRNLTDMTAAGLLGRTDLGDHVWRFELRRSERSHLEEHPHFLCTKCGNVACLPAATISVRGPARGGPRAIKHGRYALQLQGLCDSCSS